MISKSKIEGKEKLIIGERYVLRNGENLWLLDYPRLVERLF